MTTQYRGFVIVTASDMDGAYLYRIAKREPLTSLESETRYATPDAAREAAQQRVDGIVAKDRVGA